MLDAFGSDNPDDYIAGFPEHPHRGFETVSYMLNGRMRHRDSAGHEGLVTDGGVQWMTAARGVIHSEIPQQTAGRMEGFQLWLNLHSSEKMGAPWYRDIQASDLPKVTTDQGVQLTVIAGESHGTAGAVQREKTQPLYLDVSLPPGSSFSQSLPAHFNAFVYVYRENLDINSTHVDHKTMAVLRNDGQSDGVVLKAPDENKLPTRALLIAGQALREPIAQYGPFVMNTREQLIQAVEDFNNGRLA